jgi:hypothetical protein
MSTTCFGICSSIFQNHILSKTNLRYHKVQHFQIVIVQTYFSRFTNNICPWLPLCLAAASQVHHELEQALEQALGEEQALEQALEWVLE